MARNSCWDGRIVLAIVACAMYHLDETGPGENERRLALEASNRGQLKKEDTHPPMSRQLHIDF
jgi:hypothetical protein